jgi:hypothetical protein
VTEPHAWKRELKSRIADEAGYIRDAFHAKGGVDIGFVREGAGVGYMYAEGELLVLDQDLERVINILRGLPGTQFSGDPRYVLAGLAVVSFTSDWTVPVILDEIDRLLGEGVATPNHVITTAPSSPSSTGEVSPCAPVEVGEVHEGIEPYPSVCQSNSGAGVRIYISDTGLLPDADSHSWLGGVEGDPDPLSPNLTGGELLPYAGHGTFVAGGARSMAPRADVFVSNVFATAGSALETDFAADLQSALRRGADIIHVSGTAPTRKNLPLLSFSRWLTQLRRYKSTVCVAAAGNSGSSRVSWPAASPEVISVGALAADWRSRANFSNYGGWVDVYAPGRNLINAYTTGQYRCQMTPYAGQVRTFHGMVQWSGTSFSSPIFTGLLAARMWRTGENAAQAAAALLDEARSSAIPGVGAIVLPCCDRRDSRCACDPHRSCDPHR